MKDQLHSKDSLPAGRSRGFACDINKTLIYSSQEQAAVRHATVGFSRKPGGQPHQSCAGRVVAAQKVPQGRCDAGVDR
jgi:hypothetical protein